MVPKTSCSACKTPYVLPTIKQEQASEFIEQPLFPDISTEDMVDKQKPFDVKDLFRIDEYKAWTIVKNYN